MPARLPWRRAACISALSLLVLLLPSAARATNAAPNPGFEANCAGVPCQWTGGGFQGSPTTLLYDTQNPHSGNASIKITVSGRFGSIESDCVPVVTGPVSFSFWYRTSDPNATNLQYVPNFWADADCSGYAGASNSVFAVPLRDGLWHFSGTQTMTVPQGPKAMSLALSVACDPCQQGGATAEANLDDIVFESTPPTAVAVRSLTARAEPKGIVLDWRTGSDDGMLGFNVFCSGQRLNRTLLAARGRVGGSAYRFLDRRPAGQRQRCGYRLQTVLSDGSVRWFGPKPGGGGPSRP